MAGNTSVLDGVMVMLCRVELLDVALGKIQDSQAVVEVWIGLTIVEEVVVVFHSPQTVLDVVVVGMTGLTMVLEVEVGFGQATHSVVGDVVGVTGLTGVDEEDVWFHTTQTVDEEVWTGATGVDELDDHGSQAVLET
jgi:hypothetical protein